MRTGAPWAPVYSTECSLASIPILEFPGLHLPGRQRLHAPLLPAVRRPVTETRGFLDFRLDNACRLTAPRLARRVADHIDEFRLLGHGPLLRNASPMVCQSAPGCLRTRCEKALTLRECLSGMIPKSGSRFSDGIMPKQEQR